jgi:LPS sulfotransferase NodH
LRIQAASLPGLLAELRRLFGAQTDRFLPDHVLMSNAFGPCHYIHIRRLDGVAQAISRLKAEVSQVWHLDSTEPAGVSAYASYDADRLDVYRAEVAAGNLLWEQWFATNGIAPQRLDYETFALNPADHVRALLGNVGLSVPADTDMVVLNRRMADDESAMWAARYRADRGLPTEGSC